MRVACVLLPNFEVLVELSRRPELAGKPVVVGGLPYERKAVRSRSPEAAAHGIVESMPLRQAHSLCPHAIFLPPDEELYRETFARILQIMDGFSPTVEGSYPDMGAPGCVPLRSARHSALIAQPSPLAIYLDASGLELLFGAEDELGQQIARSVEREMGLSPQVGLASGRFVARMAALLAPRGSALVVREGNERHFLAALPVEHIPCSPETLRRLHMLGFRTMGELAKLPPGALAEQFGPEGAEIHRLARAIDERPRVPREMPPFLEAETEIDPPTHQVTILLSAASILLDGLVARMRSNYVACREVALHLGFSGGPTLSLATTLHERTDHKGVLTRAVERLVYRVPALTPTLSHWERVGVRARAEGSNNHLVSSLRISLSGFGGHHGEQLQLFRSGDESLKRVQQAVQRAEERFGAGAIRPLAELAMEKAAEPIRVAADAKGRPRALFLREGWERVLEVCNRWRVDGDWWRKELSRDYYRVITENGRLCVLFRELTPQLPSIVRKGEKLAPWFLERVYD